MAGGTCISGWISSSQNIIQRFSRAGPRGRAREWATLGVHPLSWLLSNNRLEEVCGTLTKGTFSSWLLLSNQDKGCTPSVAHFLPLPLPPGFCSTCQVKINSGCKQAPIISWTDHYLSVNKSYLAKKKKKKKKKRKENENFQSSVLHLHQAQCKRTLPLGLIHASLQPWQ